MKAPLFSLDCNKFTEGLARVRVKDKTRFMDKKGNLVINFNDVLFFDFPFSEGLTLARDKEHNFGYIDKKGVLVIPCVWHLAHQFSESLAAVKNENGWHFINKYGNIVLKSQWNIKWGFVGNFAIVEKEEKYGFIDKTGKLLGEIEWDETRSFSEGLAMVRKGEKIGYINKSGKIKFWIK